MTTTAPERLSDATVAEAAAPRTGGGVGAALGAMCDVLLMVATLSAAWWAWDGADRARSRAPSWDLASSPAAADGIALRLDGLQQMHQGDRALANDGELAWIVRTNKPRSAQVTVDGQALFANLSRVLESLSRQGVRQANVKIGP